MGVNAYKINITTNWFDTYVTGNQNPAFQAPNTTPWSPSFTGFHDAMHFGSGMTAATAPPYLITNACAAAPSLCAIYVNTRTDKNFLQSSSSKQQP
jgi:hypothetical protein